MVKKTSQAFSISKQNIPLLYVISFLSELKFTMPIWVLFLQQTLTNGEITLLSSILFISALVFELPTGALADLIGKKKTIFSGFIVSALATIAFSLSTQFNVLIIVFVLSGLGEALVSGAYEALLYDSLKQDGREDKFRSINAKNMYVVQIGFIGGTLLGGWLGSIDLRWPFWIYSVILVISSFLTIFIKEPAIDTEKFTLRNYARQTILGFKQITQSKFIRWFSILYVLVGGISWIFQRLVNFMVLIDLGYSEMAIGVTTAFFRLLNILILVKLLQIIHKKVGFTDILLLPILMVIIYLPGIWFTKFTAIPFIGGAMLIATARFILLNPYVNQLVESKYRATAISALNMWVSFVYIISTVILGVFFTRLSPSAVFTVFGVLSLIFIVPLGIKVKQLANHHLK